MIGLATQTALPLQVPGAHGSPVVHPAPFRMLSMQEPLVPPHDLGLLHSELGHEYGVPSQPPKPLQVVP